LPPRELQVVADAAVPPDQPGTWTHAVMDVGATLCKPRAPRCGDCPAQPWCRFAARAADVVTPPAPPTTRSARERAAPFASTNRWLRGRILDRLRAEHGDAWIALDGDIGTHDRERVIAAARAMAADGVVELETRDDGRVRARLPLA
jgi:A/G-specific adenine glycosylase